MTTTPMHRDNQRYRLIVIVFRHVHRKSAAFIRSIRSVHDAHIFTRSIRLTDLSQQCLILPLLRIEKKTTHGRQHLTHGIDRFERFRVEAHGTIGGHHRIRLIRSTQEFVESPHGKFATLADVGSKSTQMLWPCDGIEGLKPILQRRPKRRDFIG